MIVDADDSGHQLDRPRAQRLEALRRVAHGVGGFEKLVVVKMLLAHLSRDQGFMAMFLDEARLSLHLQHANVVHVFDIGIAEQAYFIVMEFVDGANLKSIGESIRKQGREFPVSAAVFICAEICKGLSYAHEMKDAMGVPQHIVHRDMSPPNVLVTKHGEVKIVDFGLAYLAIPVLARSLDRPLLPTWGPGLVLIAATGMPIATASGTFGYGVECAELTDVSLLGAVVTKSVVSPDNGVTHATVKLTDGRTMPAVLTIPFTSVVPVSWLRTAPPPVTDQVTITPATTWLFWSRTTAENGTVLRTLSLWTRAPFAAIWVAPWIWAI